MYLTYLRHFVLKTQSEPGLGHIDFDGLVVVRELAVHQNLPFEKSSKC